MKSFSFPFLMAMVLLLSQIVSSQPLAPAGAYKGDQVLFEPDRATTGTKKNLDELVQWEQANRLFLWSADHNIKKAADHVRRNAKGWFQTAINLREAYARTPTPENRDKLQGALNIIEQALTEYLKYKLKYEPQ